MARTTGQIIVRHPVRDAVVAHKVSHWSNQTILPARTWGSHMIHAHQPGSQPIDIPEVIPNPQCGRIGELGRLWLFFEWAKLRPPYRGGVQFSGRIICHNQILPNATVEIWCLSATTRAPRLGELHLSSFRVWPPSWPAGISRHASADWIQ